MYSVPDTLEDKTGICNTCAQDEVIELQRQLAESKQTSLDILNRSLNIIASWNCENHGGDKCPPYQEFFERLKGHCCLCSIDQIKQLTDRIRDTEGLKDSDIFTVGYLDNVTTANPRRTFLIVKEQ